MSSYPHNIDFVKVQGLLRINVAVVFFLVLIQGIVKSEILKIMNQRKSSRIVYVAMVKSVFLMFRIKVYVNLKAWTLS